MNILFFLTPKAMCAYIEAGDTLRQAMERMEHSGYAALPVIDKSGKYCGVVTEGDLLWTIKRLCVMDLRQTEEHSISEIEHRRTVQPVRVDTRVEDLISVAADQNFVPVVDDKGDFIGIVTRSRILKYCLQTGFLLWIILSLGGANKCKTTKTIRIGGGSGTFSGKRATTSSWACAYAR